MTCPSSLLLSQAFSRGVTGELHAHLSSCPSCAALWKAMEQARDAVQELPYVVPDPERREGVRKRLLLLAARQPISPSPRPLPRWVAWASVAAAVLAVLLGARLLPERSSSRQSASHFRAMVQSQGASSFVHERTGGDEWVRLSDGTLHIEVQPLAVGERFRVLCGDGEVEVRGTSFETAVERDRLVRVYVLHGRVEVRPYGGPPLVLDAGGRWQASIASSLAASPDPATRDPATRPAPIQGTGIGTLAAEPAPGAPSLAAIGRTADVMAATQVRTKHAPGALSMRRSVAAAGNRSPGGSGARPSSASPRSEDDPNTSSARPGISAAELAFMEGWTALRQGRHQLAAAAFARATEHNSGAASASLLEDARFWRGVALARANQRQAAIAALREYLSHHPTAVRSGEASAILGWQLLREGQLDAARRCFETAEKDSHAAVRDNARSGLAALAARR